MAHFVIKPDCPQYTWGKLLVSEDLMAFMPLNVMMIPLRNCHLHLQSKSLFPRLHDHQKILPSLAFPVTNTSKDRQ